jgi:hypothetical protein
LISLTAAALFAPQIPTIVREWDQFQKRVENVSIFTQNAMPLGYPTRTSLALHQLGKTVRYLTVGAAIGGVHYAPTDRSPFHPALVPFLLIGLAAALWHWRTGLWWWLLLVVPVIATQGLSVVGDPNLARMAVTCGVFFWFIGYGLDTVTRWFRTRWQPAITTVLVIGAGIITVSEWQYFEQWMLSAAVANARGGGVDYQDYARWQQMQFQRIEANKPHVPVVEWERPEVREALLAPGATSTP